MLCRRGLREDPSFALILHEPKIPYLYELVHRPLEQVPCVISKPAPLLRVQNPP